MRLMCDRIEAIKGSLIWVKAHGVSLRELAQVFRQDGSICFASVLRFDGDRVVLQLFGSARGISTGDRVTFLQRTVSIEFGDSLLGRQMNGLGSPIDGGGNIKGEPLSICTPIFNPVRRRLPKDQVRTNIPMIDVFNCLVKSQKIPIFSTPGEPHNALLMRIAEQSDADLVVIGGMGLRFDEYQSFVQRANESGSMKKTIMLIHQANDPPMECVLIPDLALTCAEKFAIERDKNVLVLLTDMTAFADALKEIAITMDQVPSNRGYPGSLYSDLASRYEKAVDTQGKGSVTILSVTTMPGNDVTHPVPDNTGYITEGQFYLNGGRIDPFGSLSRLKQQVIGKVTREDHGDLADVLIRLYAEGQKARDRHSMGFVPSAWDCKLLKFSDMFEEGLMSLDVNISLEEALDKGWTILSKCITQKESGLPERFMKYWGNRSLCA